MNVEFPVAYFESNITFTPDKNRWAGYEVIGFQYNMRSTDAKKTFYNMLHSMGWQLNNTIKILLIPKEYSYKNHFENLKARITGPFSEFAHYHANETRAWLEDVQGDIGIKYKIYLLINIDKQVSLKDHINNVKELFHSIFLEPKEKTDRLMGVSGLEIPTSEMNYYQEIEDRVFKQFSKYFRLTRTNEEINEWLIRRNFWKGIAEPPKKFIWQSDVKTIVPSENSKAIHVKSNKRTKDIIKKGNKEYIRPRYAEFINLTEGDIDLKTNSRYIKTTQLVGDEEKSSYSAYLTFSDIADDLFIPGNEYLYLLNELPFPVGVSMYIEPMDNEEAKKNVRNKKQEIDDQSDHVLQATDLPLTLLESGREAMLLEKELDDTRSPMLDISYVFEVVAATEKELYERIDILKSFYKGMHFELVNPAGEQWMLFNEFMPIGPRFCSIDYVHRVTPSYLAASMFAATNRLGDDDGFYIGTTGVLNQPVFFDPSRGPRINKSGSGAFIGTLGGGKSYTANYLLYLTTLYGGKGFIVDPKGDRTKWKGHLKEFGDQLDYVTLEAREEDFGKLDPWGFLPRDHAEQVALNIIAFLANIKVDDEEFHQVSEAIEKVKLLKDASMMKIIEQLEKTEEETGIRLARKLRAFARLPYAKLLFFDGPLNSISLEKRVTILHVKNLDLPDKEVPRSDYDISNILSISLMFSITAFVTKFAEDPNEFTTVLYDEFWTITNSKEGSKLSKRLIRTGRSEYAAIFIISQNADDLIDEQIKNNLGFKFVFRSGDRKEIEKILEFLDLETTPDNINLIKSIENGKPLFQDLDGQTGIVDIDVVFDHIDKAFNTTAGKKKEEVEEVIV